MDRLCVFCGSNAGDDTAYADAARTVGRTLAEREMGLVYGGGRIGLMGVVAGATLDAGGDVRGVIPERLLDREQPHGELTELEVVDSFETRKKRMSTLADGFLALPGGFGTLDELVEAVTWTQHGVQDKPCGLLNVAGFFDHLVAFFEHQTAAGFVSRADRELVTVGDDVDDLLDRFVAFESDAR
ncbi:MAG: TIGR00730 family Rossman fold protein [Salinirussus sp.]